MKCQFRINEFKTLQTSQVLNKMNQVEKEIPISLIDEVHFQWVYRWIKLKCWLELYGE